MMTLILLAFSFFPSMEIRQEVFLIPADMKPQWISIEYDNPKCPQLDGTEFYQEFVVPESGYLCTSSPIYRKYYQRSFYLLDGNSKRTPLKAEENILLEGVLSQDNPSRDAGQPDCKVSIGEFFYGKKGDLKSNNPIFQDEKFLVLHPECRNVGKSYPKNPF